MTIMIDNDAKDGGQPNYANGDRAYPVGLSTVMPQPGQPSGMMMRHVWRDNINPPWGSLKDVNGVDCTLLTMYFITYGTVQDLTQNLPTYKFPVPATASGPAPVIDFGVPKTSSMVVSQPPSSLVAQEFLSSEVAAEEVTPDTGTNAAVKGVGPTDGSGSADGTAPDSTTTFNGTASKNGTDPEDGTRQVDEGKRVAEGDGVAPIGENVPDPELGGDTIEDVEKEMDAEPEGEKDEEEVDLQAPGGAVLKW
ncbi:hypothetical protein LTR46_005090 [Exophiala xenobiotica]|nr:hypothetical protein LTR46_005090 [Exophiala xenobiotica]